MELTPNAWKGTDLTQYKAVFSSESPLYGNASFSEIQRAQYWPLRGGKSFTGLVYILQLFPPSGTTIGTFRNEIGLLFNEEDNAEYQFLCNDQNNGGEQFYVMCEPLGLLEPAASYVKVAIHAAIPAWQSYLVQTNTKAFTASGQTKDITVGGNRIARPQYNLTVTSPRTGSYAYKRYIIVCNQKSVAYTDALNLTDGNFNTSALVSGGKMQATCADLRITLDGNEIYRYLGGGGANSTTTRPFSNINLPPQIVLTLSGGLSNVGAISTIPVKNTADNKTALKQLAAQKNKVIVLSLKGAAEEVFTYTSVNLNAMTITGTKRAQRLSSNKTHVDNETIRHVPHDIYMIYGNSAVSAPSTPLAWQPMFDIANSTNSSHAYVDYKDPSNPHRAGQFISNITKNVGGKCEIYTANHYTNAIPSSEMGMVIRSYKVGATPRAPDGLLFWTLTHSAGMTSVTVSGEKFRLAAGTGWPAKANLRKSNDGKAWTEVANEATPTAANAYQALTTVTGTLSLSGTYTNIGFFFEGTVAKLDGDTYAAIEFDGVTVALDTSGIPMISFGAENTVEFHDFQILNNTTSQWMSFTFPGDINNNIYIDTDGLDAYVVETGERIVIRLDDETRADWLPLDPSQGSGVNTVQVISAGLAGMTLTETHRKRSQP